MTILLVENNCFNQQTVTTMLDAFGWNLDATLDSLAQVEPYLAHNKPELVIANMFLGSEACVLSLIKDTEKKGIPVLFLVPAASDNLPTQAAPYTNFLLKPFHPQSLKAVVNLLLPS